MTAKEIQYHLFYDTKNGVSPRMDLMTDEEYYREDREIREERLHYGSLPYEYRSYMHAVDPEEKRRHLRRTLLHTGHMYMLSPETNDRILDYLLSPTKQHARYLLMAFGIPVPLELLYRKLRQTNDVLNEEDYSSHGGDDWAVPITRRNFAFCDFLHDLQDMSDMALKEKIQKRVLNMSTLTTANKLMIKTAFMNGDVNKTIKDIFMGSDSIWGRYEIRCKKENNDETYILEKEKEIIRQWQSWLDQGKASIMLDGITNVAISDAISTQDLVKGILQCAFVHLLFSNAVKVHLKSGQYAVTAHEKPETKDVIPTVELLDGFMNQMDRVELLTFFQQWVQSVQVDGRVANIIIKSVVSVNLHRFYNPLVKMNTDTKRVEIPIRGTTFDFPFSSNTFSYHDYHNKVTSVDRTKYITQHYSMDRPKTFFHTLFKYIDDISNDLIEALITANFLRDAVKTEVAMQEQAVFITCDQLAFVYYVMQCRMGNRGPKGFWFNENVLFYRPVTQTTRLSKR